LLTSTYYSEIYPLDLYNLPRYPTFPATPIAYLSKTASSVPGSPQTYGYLWDKRDIPAPTPMAKVEERQQGMLSFLATYPPSHISSGCSCLSVRYQETVTESTFSYIEKVLSGLNDLLFILLTAHLTDR